MTVINNTGVSSIKIFCESTTADVDLGNARKVWSLQKPIVITNPNQVKILCSVESCSIPLSFYTVNESNNRIRLNGTTYALEFGNYSATSIILELQRIQSIVTFEYIRAKSKFVLKTDTSVVIEEIKGSIYNLLGLIPVSFQGEYTAPHVINLIYTTGLYVSLNNISNNNIDTGGGQNQTSTCLLRLPINQPANTYLQFFNNAGFKNLLSTSILNQIDISILDDKRNLLELTENVAWTVVLRIDFERTVIETQDVSRIQELRTGNKSRET